MCELSTIVRRNIRVFSCLLLLAACISPAFAQKHFGVHSFGVNVGRYSPAMDAWKDTVWEFGPATMVGADMDLDMARQVRLRIGAAAGSTTAEVLRNPGVGPEQLEYRFVPIGATVMVHTNAGPANVYGGAGVDMMSISTTYKSAVDFSKISGSAYLPHVLAGVQLAVMDRLSLSFQVRQVLGTYDQQFQLEGDDNVRVTQPIEMNGLYWSVGARLML
jgi:opacity protein-like surface antigen